ncbi:MAG: hypothetical protein LBE49_00235, partial [Deltaproteobacteria bacterium]|nr:hypothetical protein [Deltaproteobacteria bacterium]
KGSGRRLAFASMTRRANLATSKDPAGDLLRKTSQKLNPREKNQERPHMAWKNREGLEKSLGY